MKYRTKFFQRKNTAQVVVVNVLLVAALFIVMIFQLRVYSNNIMSQNISRVQSLNRSCVGMFETMFESDKVELNDIAGYCMSQKMSDAELLDFLYSYDMDENTVYELIGADFTGYAAAKDDNGDFIPLTYLTSSYKPLQKIFAAAESMNPDILPTSEFTDKYSSLKSIALCDYVTLQTEDGEKPFTLMSVFTINSIRDILNSENSYENLSTVLIDSEGNYLLAGSEFKSTNFFNYLYTYNNLTEKQRRALIGRFENERDGWFLEENYADEECLYVFSYFEDNDWYSVTCVPTTSFISNSIDWQLVIVISGFILAILIYNLIWLGLMTKKLRLSIENEKDANAAKTDFLSRMSHDMRTPMNGILGLTELSEDMEMSDEVRRTMSKIRSAGDYLLGLINDTLDMSKIESGKLLLNEKPTDNMLIVEEIVDMITAYSKSKNIKFTVRQTNVERHLIMADKLRLEQVLINVLTNAVKFSYDGGEVFFDIICLERDENTTHTRFIVTDHGIGMSEDYLPKLWEPFYQESDDSIKNVQGTGLGMPIVKSLVDMMGGKIDVRSKKHEGTVITIEMSFAITHDATESKGRSAYSAVTAGKRLLLCEDNMLNQEIAVSLLEREKYIVDVADNGKIGVEKFASSEPFYYSAVLMDVSMPIMNGYDATREIRALSREDAETVPIIAMTANAYADDVRACIEAGMNAHVAKPIDTKQLMQTIADYIGANDDSAEAK